MPIVGSRSLGTKLGEAGIVILIHCAIMLLKILTVYCLGGGGGLCPLEIEGRLIPRHVATGGRGGATAPQKFFSPPQEKFGKCSL